MQPRWRVACVRIPRFPIGAVWRNATDAESSSMQLSFALETPTAPLRPSPLITPPFHINGAAPKPPATGSTIPPDEVFWDEKPIVEYDEGRKLTHAKVTKTFSGDLVGSSVLEYLMVYPPEPPVPYVGVERFTGTFLGKQGSFALTITGTYDGRAIEQAMINDGVAPGVRYAYVVKAVDRAGNVSAASAETEGTAR